MKLHSNFPPLSLRPLWTLQHLSLILAILSRKKENLLSLLPLPKQNYAKYHNSEAGTLNRKSSTNITILLSPPNIYIYIYIYSIYANKYREICKVKLERGEGKNIYFLFSLPENIFSDAWGGIIGVDHHPPRAKGYARRSNEKSWEKFSGRGENSFDSLFHSLDHPPPPPSSSSSSSFFLLASRRHVPRSIFESRLGTGITLSANNSPSAVPRQNCLPVKKRDILRAARPRQDATSWTSVSFAAFQ